MGSPTSVLTLFVIFSLIHFFEKISYFRVNLKLKQLISFFMLNFLCIVFLTLILLDPEAFLNFLLFISVIFCSDLVSGLVYLLLKN